MNQLGNSHNSRGAYKKHQVRDYSLRMSRINDEKLLNNSVHEFTHKKQPGSGSGGAGGIDLSLHELSISHGQGGGSGGHHSHSKSLMKSPVSAALDDLSLSLPVDKKKEILEKKRYEQLHKNYNQ